MPSTLPSKSVKGLLIKSVGKGNLTKYSVTRILDISLDIENQESFIFSVVKVLGFFPFESWGTYSSGLN